ncbi:hypothetical protein LTR53_003950 [Teratosphaeriaceae sp. CCFEE 6253]|nr:hypothetical protein LTR53_003950 [Teratosphaeriaceae sp. CCFEE 6253]
MKLTTAFVAAGVSAIVSAQGPIFTSSPPCAARDAVTATSTFTSSVTNVSLASLDRDMVARPLASHHGLAACFDEMGIKRIQEARDSLAGLSLTISPGRLAPTPMELTVLEANVSSNDNLAGYPPLGVNYAPCWTCGANSSRSACSKNGIVYPSSGAELGTAQFSVNDTSVCNAPPPAGPPYANGTTPAGPMANTTTPPPPGGASPTGTGAPGSSGSALPVPYNPANAGTSVQMGAGAVIGFAMLFAALGMM